MSTRENDRVKDVLVSIFVGAVVAFISTLLQGILDVLKHVDIPIVSGLIGMVKYMGSRLV